jgi:hypothetical protein
MKETIALDDARFVANLPDHARAGLSDTGDRLAARSMIIWGEHCCECAAPACYSACNFYSPRSDGHCRRFVNGIETVMDPEVRAGAVTRVVFRRQWKVVPIC